MHIRDEAKNMGPWFLLELCLTRWFRSGQNRQEVYEADVSYSKQQALNMVMPDDDVSCKETLSLAEMKSTDPGVRVMSERAAADVATASPSMTSRMPAESSALTVYCRAEAGIWR